jgi:hypothetical protein
VDPAVIGAFLSGIAAVVSSLVSLHLVQKRDRANCEQRIRELKEALQRGIEIGEKH